MKTGIGEREETERSAKIIDKKLIEIAAPGNRSCLLLRRYPVNGQERKYVWNLWCDQ